MRVVYTLRRLQDIVRAGIELKKLKVHDRWTREELVKFQHQQLSSLVRYAVRHSPFYQEVYKNIKTDREIVLNDLPIIDKATMMENFDRFVTDPRLKLRELQAHISQLTRDEYYLGEYRVLTTSGSSGIKGVFVFSRKEWSTVVAANFRGLSMVGISPRLPRFQKRWRITWIGADSPMHISYRMVVSGPQRMAKMQRLYATSSIEYLVDSLNTFQPEVLVAYPSIASLLAIEQLEGRLTIYPKIVETGAEVRTNEMEMKIREAWAVTPFNIYLTTEGGGVNVDCPFHRGIHIFEDLLIIEVVDEQNQPVQDGSPGYKLLITNLFNFTQPLIRYEITDILTMSPDPCPCGRPFRIIAIVEGRSDDVIYLHTPQGREVPVHPIHFDNAIGMIHGIKEYCVVHEANGIDINVVLKEGVSREEVTARLRANLRENLELLGVKYPDIRVRFVDRIARDPRMMGKLKLVKSNVRRGE